MLPYPLSAEFLPAMAQKTTIEQMGDSLVVEWRSKKIDVVRRVVVFSGGVKATYGLTVLYAQELELDLEAHVGRAKGTVNVVDPEGTLEGGQVQFNWQDHTGQADDVHAHAGGARFDAATVRINPGKWILEDVYATPCHEVKPLFAIRSKRITVYPGKNGKLDNTGIDILGRHIGTFPGTSFSLDNRASGFKLPGISYRRRDGFGVSWSQSVLIRDEAVASSTFSSFPKKEPAYGAHFIYTGSPGESSNTPLLPVSELDERFSQSYMDNISVATWAQEDDTLRNPRHSIGVGLDWNQSTVDRRVDSTGISKRYELFAERGGNVGPIGGLVQARFQNIRPGSGEAFVTRTVISAEANSGLHSLGKNLFNHFRFEGAGYLGGGSEYEWVRAQAAITARPWPGLQLSSSLVLGGSHGRPLFGFDPLYSQSGYHVRADLFMGSLTTSFLGRYDFGRRGWYDHEVSIALNAGCVEPYVVWRQFPSDLRFGLRLNIGTLGSKLHQRRFERSKSMRAP